MRTGETRKVAGEIRALAAPWTLRQARQRFERAYVDDILTLCEGDRQLACELLDISLSSLKEKLQPGFGGRP